MKSRTKMKKLLLLVVLLFSFTVYGWSQKVSLDYNNEKIEKVLASIKSQTKMALIFSDQVVDVNRLVSIRVKDCNLNVALDKLLVGTNVTYEIKNNKIYLIEIKANQTTPSKKKKVSGVVTDAAGDPIIGANVLEKGDVKNGIITDMDGQFSLEVDANSSLFISYIGYLAQEVPTKGRDSFRIVLKEDAQTLDEVVVVGFGVQKKVNLTGSVGVVTMEDLKERPVTNLTQALQGIVPGLQITQTNGSLEDSPSINVRGTTTIGQGTSGAPLVLIDGMEGDINTINPQDIANISVLKDAAASSIYGSRAPFGVILITTKSGKNDEKMSVNYNNSFRWGSPINMNHMMNSVDFSSWVNDAHTNGGSGVFFDKKRMDQIVAYHNAQPYSPGRRITSDGTILDAISANTNGLWNDGYRYGIDDIDWFDAIFKKSTFSQEHNFSVNGGTKKLNYYASFNYLNQGGLMNMGEEGMNRFNGTAKIGTEITSWLKFNYSMRFIRKDIKRPAKLTNNLYEVMATQGWPVLPLHDPNGFYYSAPSPALGLAEGGVDKTQADDMYHQAGFVIEPIKNWVTHVDFNYRIYSANRHWDKQKLFNHNAKGESVEFEQDSNIHEDLYKENYYTFNAYTEYTHQFNQIHNFHVMAGFQAENLDQTSFGLQRVGIMFPGKSEIDLSTGLDNDGEPVAPEVYGARNDWATAGFFGRINYDFDGKYLIEMNLRADGTSRFRKNNRWKAFPSVSVGWNIAREKFFEPLNDVVGMLKLRASFGSLGNQNTTNWYQTYQTMSVGAANGSWLMNGKKTNTAYAPGLVSTSLTWETIQNYNVALDWAMFNNRLTGTVEYYIRDTKDMVGLAPDLPYILGTAVPVTNNTDLRTSGWELSIGWQDRLKNGLSYGARFNVSDSRTKITRYPNNPMNGLDKYITGRYMGEIWGYTTKGLARTDEEMQQHLATLPNGGQDAIGSDWKAGDIMYADINGDGKISTGSGVIGDTGDLSVIGNNSPRYMFGLDLNASWKGFDVRAFFQGVMKRDVWQGSIYLFGTGGGGVWQAAGITSVKDYFRNENTWSVQEGYQSANTDAYLPRPLYNGKNQQTQTRYLQNAAYIRLKNLQVGYTIPARLTSHWGIQTLRVFFSGENLWTGTGVDKQFDPETISGGWGGVGYPLSRTLSCGLTITL